MSMIAPMSADAAARLYEDFDRPVVAEDTPPLPVAPTYSESELTAARLEAWNDGYLAAAASVSRQFERDRRDLFAEMLARSDEMDHRLEQMTEQNAAALAQWLVSVFATAFPTLQHSMMTERTRVVIDLLRPALRSQSKIEVHVGEGPIVSFHNMHDVCRQIETQQTEDPTGGSITIAWQQGEARIDASKTWDDIQNAIIPVMGGEPAGRFELILNNREASGHVG